MPTDTRPPRRGRIAVAAALTGVVTAGGAVASTAAGADAAKAPLTWTACPDGTTGAGPLVPALCATLRVPLDYRRPHGATATLALAKLPARDQAHRIGSLIIDFGGPDASGVETLRDPTKPLSATLRDRFDLISLDPRGVANSTPDISCLSDSRLDAYYAAPRPPADATEAKKLIALNAEFVSGCVNDLGDRLPHIGFDTTARDIDQVRRALGEPRLNYLGLSGGGYIGTRYAELFPGHIRTMVLDSPINHSIDMGTFLLDEVGGFEQGFNSFVSWCKVSAGCAIHQADPTADPGAAFDQLVRDADRHPIPSSGPDTRPVSGSDIRLTVLAMLQLGKQNWPIISMLIQQARTGDGSFTRLVGDAIARRSPDGTYSPFSGARHAIMCDSWPAPATTVRGFQRLADQAAAIAPRFGAARVWDWAPNCVGWPSVPDPVHTPRIRRPVNVVVVGTTLDPPAPYKWAVQIAGQIPGAVLVTNIGTTHTAFAAGRCQAIEDAYFTTGTPPGPGSTCPAVPPEM
jgi:pimeloyl-ACP methyl ester carboxylesterase